MLNNDTYVLLLMAQMKRGLTRAEISEMTARQLRMASHGKVVSFILHETGKALVSTGNRLLARA